MLAIQQFIRCGLLAVTAAALFGCQPSYSPDTYSAGAVQQANKVEPGTVIGFREVKISADGTVGAVTGAAAGGILGAQPDVSGAQTALGAVAGGVIGSLVGTTIEHATGDTTGWDYIVRQPNGDLISVTQREPKPIAIGQKVLVITGKQARIVPDYGAALPADKTDASKDKAAKDADKAKADAKEAPKPAAPAPVAATDTPKPADDAPAVAAPSKPADNSAAKEPAAPAPSDPPAKDPPATDPPTL